MLKKSAGLILGIAALLVLSYFIPSLVTYAEDRSLKKDSKSYEIETVDITTKTSTFLEKLQEFSSIQYNSKISIDEGICYETDQIHSLLIEFLEEIYYIEDPKIMDYKDEVYMVSTKEYENVYCIWCSYFMDKDGRLFEIRVDDTSGKVLGFFLGGIDSAWLKNNLDSLGKVLAGYYGFSSGEIVYYFEYGNVANLVLFDEKGNEKMNLPMEITDSYICFNLHRRDILVFETSENADSFNNQSAVK